MFIAVSILSPVRIHNFIPACLICFIASGTPSYSRSSMAVDPHIYKFYSSNLNASSRYWSLNLPCYKFAFLKTSVHCWYYSSVISRFKKSRVLSP
jgi:hypothetical protein